MMAKVTGAGCTFLTIRVLQVQMCFTNLQWRYQMQQIETILRSSASHVGYVDEKAGRIIHMIDTLQL